MCYHSLLLRMPLRLSPVWQVTHLNGGGRTWAAFLPAKQRHVVFNSASNAKYYQWQPSPEDHMVPLSEVMTELAVCLILVLGTRGKRILQFKQNKVDHGHWKVSRSRSHTCITHHASCTAWRAAADWNHAPVGCAWRRHKHSAARGIVWCGLRPRGVGSAAASKGYDCTTTLLCDGGNTVDQLLDNERLLCNIVDIATWESAVTVNIYLL